MVLVLCAVIEANASTLRLLESVQERMKKMTGDELSRFCLDNRLGGMSETLHFKVRDKKLNAWLPSLDCLPNMNAALSIRP